MADLFGRLAGEFAGLADLARSLQDLPGRLAPAGLDAAAVMAAQRIDELTQRLDAMTSFVGALGSLAPPAWTLDAGPALSLLTLADVRRRLGGLDEAPRAGPDCADEDGFELF